MTAFTLERLSGDERSAAGRTRGAQGTLRRAVAGFGQVMRTGLRAGAAYDAATTRTERRQVLDRFAARS